jgi:hypothetical protein
MKANSHGSKQEMFHLRYKNTKETDTKVFHTFLFVIKLAVTVCTCMHLQAEINEFYELWIRIQKGQHIRFQIHDSKKWRRAGSYFWRAGGSAA